MVKFADRVKVAIAQNGGAWPSTGTIYLGSAAAGFQSVPTSLDGETIRYVIEHGTDWEIGSGTFNNSAQTVSRSLASSSTGSLLDIDGAADFFISPSAADLQLQLDSTNYSVTNYTASSGSNTFDASSTPALPAYQAGKLAVYVNGVLQPASGYTATNGTSVVMTLAVNDEVSIVNHGAASSGSSVTTVTNVSGASDSLTAISSPDVGDIVFVTSTNGLFIRKSNGWFKIADVTNAQPTNLTGVSDSALATDGTATTITLAATDPEGLTLTFSAAAKTGSSTTFSAALTDGNTVNALNGATVIATVAQASNVFTITPNTASNAGTVDITFSVTDGINAALTDDGQFTLTFVTIVTDSKHTTLLVTATGTSDNNNITDSSTANSGSGHNITVTGDAHAGTFSPYRSGGYSTYFAPSSNDYIDFTGSKSAIGTGDFSVSFWMYPTAGNDKTIIDTRSPNSTYAAFDLYIGGNDNLYYRSRASGGTYTSLISGSAVDLNKWSYVLINRTNNTTTMYINGASKASSTSMNVSYAPPTGLPRIGMRSDASSWDFEGYIRDVHIQTGAVSTPTNVPTEAATVTSNTYLLACHLPYFKDGSTSNYTVSVGGTPSLKPFSPYDYNKYASTDHGGSVYFDGSGDGLSIPHTSNVGNFGTGQFTVEFWFNPKTILSSGQELLVDFMSGTSGLRIIRRNDETIRVRNGDTNLIVGTTIFDQINAWYHVCVHRNSSNELKLFVNGTQEGSTLTGHTDNYASPSSGNWFIAQNYNNGNYFTGYISDLRVTHGEAITPSSSTLTSKLSVTNNTKFLLSGTDASIIDKSQGANLNLFGNTTGSTTQAKFSNTKSMYFDGNGDHIEIDGPFNLGTQPWTWEAWIYTGDSSYTLVNIGESASTGFSIEKAGSSYYIYDLAANTYYSVSNVAANNTWTHLAFCRQSNGNHDFYKDGSRVSNYTSWNSKNWGSLAKLKIGEYWTTNQSDFSGYLQDVRLTVGKSRYTAADETSNIPSAPLEG